jgi:hypothetical protein
MSTAQHVTPGIDNETDLRRALDEIRGDVSQATSRDDLTSLYRHGEALIALTYTPAWQKKFGGKVENLRKVSQTEFGKLAHAVNQRAESIGTKANFDESWGGPQHVYGEVDNEADLRKISTEIRGDIDKAKSREDLTKLFRRAGYLVTLTYSPAWHEKFGAKASELRRLADDEFATTARNINQRAAQIGTDADYDEHWGSRR